MMQNHQTLNSSADTKKGADDDIQDGFVHIRKLVLKCQRDGFLYTVTTVQGLSSVYDLKKVVKACTKELGCSGKFVRHSEYGEVLQLQGDQRENVCEWLTKGGLIKPDQLKFHDVSQDLPISSNPRKLKSDVSCTKRLNCTCT